MTGLRTPWWLDGQGTQLKASGGRLIAELQDVAFEQKKIGPLLRDAPATLRDRDLAIKLLRSVPRSAAAKRWAGWEKQRDAFLKRIDRQRSTKR